MTNLNLCPKCQKELFSFGCPIIANQCGYVYTLDRNDGSFVVLYIEDYFVAYDAIRKMVLISPCSHFNETSDLLFDNIEHFDWMNPAKIEAWLKMVLFYE